MGFIFLWMLIKKSGQKTGKSHLPFSHSPVPGLFCEIANPLAWTFPDKLAETKKWWLAIKSKFESVKGKKLSDVSTYLFKI